MSNLSASERLAVIRTKDRPTVMDYIPAIFNNFLEMHGDRFYGDDAAIIGGIATLDSIPVTVIAQVKGRNLEENKRTNFSMPHPEGYRKALRLAKQAEKFHRPVICLVDTPGAFCGVEAEKRGQGEAIAKNLMEFMTLKTPVVSVVLGEGGSGGALALAVCDELAMLEHALYSVISPRGFASILWKDASRESEAAELMTEVYSMQGGTLVIGGVSYAADIVKERLRGLNARRIYDAIDQMKNAAEPIRNIRGYLLSCLFNAASTTNIRLESDYHRYREGR